MGDKRLSHFLARLLRHEAVSRGLDVTEGYVNIDDVLDQPEADGKTANDIEKIVRNDSKGRFKIRTHHGKQQIKATQGHSMPFESNELTPITHHTQARVVLHGTKYSLWPSIKSQGLSRRRRTHIHFAPGERNVTSGFPLGCDMAIEIDLNLALRDGIKFFKSENGVILSPGNSSGVISKRYFKQAYHLDPRENICLD
ncbi:tRNA 2'-phosphotransferase [Mactra antiquata]